MPSGKPAPPKRKGAAAKAAALEAADEQGVPFEWRGVEFTRPVRLPATLAFDIAEMQSGGDDFAAMFRFLMSLVGADQVAKLRDKLAEDGDSLDTLGDILDDFLSTAIEASGVGLGE